MERMKMVAIQSSNARGKTCLNVSVVRGSSLLHIAFFTIFFFPQANPARNASRSTGFVTMSQIVVISRTSTNATLSALKKLRVPRKIILDAKELVIIAE